MKSMFLLTVLFVLLAFAFKDPEQSAWDFAKDVGSNVIQKITAREEGSGEARFSRNFERNVDKNVVDNRKHLKSGEKNIQRADKVRQKPSGVSKRPTNPAPKRQPIAKPKKSLALEEHPVEKVQAPTKPKKTHPRFSIEPGHSLPAQPVKKVDAEPLPFPKLKIPVPAVTTTIDSAELAKMGARFDRASRLLSEIK